MIKPLRALGLVLALGIPVVAPAADHLDSPTAASTAEPSADITDLYVAIEHQSLVASNPSRQEWVVHDDELHWPVAIISGSADAP
jgi:hypothetical protein